MTFSKELLLSKISTMNDFDTIQYISQHSFLVPLLALWAIVIVTFILIVGLAKRPNYWLAFSISMALGLLIIILTIYGLIPALLTFNYGGI